ncbi:Uncharacterised protein [Leclercia adecarboxylata]|uniref:Uncharacterized protein n=1 Tax=Leclercia adecarboxylata TaxID=83655 RepID=A0A4U9IY27_9ENTR|nr:Uncharacterised protein [Leclercia adecarboxylata]
MRTFGQQPGIHLLQQRTKAIGIVDQVLLTMPDNGELITEDILRRAITPAKKPRESIHSSLPTLRPVLGFDYPHFSRVR